jgi:hypothetical protein
MIPRKIHYCWFGKGEKPKLAKKCISSWERYMPDYEIIEWNEDNFDINMNAYTRMCYEQKKYAFLSDYVRLLAIEQYGGIYFDTDVEVIRSFEKLLNCGAFLGFENNEYVASGLGFGAEAHHPIVQQMIKEYEPILDGQHGTVGCPILNTQALIKFGLVPNGRLQKFDNMTVYPSDYFNPCDSETGKMSKTDNTYSIHWYSASWLPWHLRFRHKIGKPIHRIIKFFR